MAEPEQENIDPDPDKREWEYDGFGVRRYKDTFALYKPKPKKENE
jgi:hypothetical protein